MHGVRSRLERMTDGVACLGWIDKPPPEWHGPKHRATPHHNHPPHAQQPTNPTKPMITAARQNKTNGTNLMRAPPRVPLNCSSPKPTHTIHIAN